MLCAILKEANALPGICNLRLLREAEAPLYVFLGAVI